MGERSLLLLTSFARALAHKIRTPLSVAVNELSALSATYPEDCSLAAARIAEINTLLKDACKISGELRLEKVLLKPLCAKYFEIDPSFSDSIGALADKNLLQFTFETLQTLFAGQGSGLKASASGTLVPNGTVALLIKGAWRDSPADSLQADSLTELLCVHLGIDSYAAPLVDAAMLAQSGSVRAELGGGTLQVSYSLPQP